MEYKYQKFWGVFLPKSLVWNCVFNRNRLSEEAATRDKKETEWNNQLTELEHWICVLLDGVYSFRTIMFLNTTIRNAQKDF
jgi:hypothetical protein